MGSDNLLAWRRTGSHKPSGRSGQFQYTVYTPYNLSLASSSGKYPFLRRNLHENGTQIFPPYSSCNPDITTKKNWEDKWRRVLITLNRVWMDSLYVSMC